MFDSKEKFLIQGLGGERTLNGEIEVSGMKNAVLPLMAAALLIDGESNFTNVPDIEDTKRMKELIEGLGGIVESAGNHSIKINARGITDTKIDEEIAKRFRGSVVLTGPLLSRFGKVSFPHPGGCVIGTRPIDLFIFGFESMGAKVKEEGEVYEIEAPKGLFGGEIYLPMITVTVTETLVMAATLGKGKTIIKNAALEPEVKDLCDFLISCGAKIKGAGTSVVEIEGVEKLHEPNGPHQVIPDRIEAGSFLILGAAAGEDFSVKKCRPDHCESIVALLKRMGVPLELGEDFMRIKAHKNTKLSAAAVKTHEYPGFPTDLQAPIAVLLTQAEGESTIFETIFEGRMTYVQDLIRMHADIKLWDAHRIAIKGPTPLSGKELEAPDIRAGLAYLLAGIIAKDETVVNKAYYIDRGYEAIETRLKNVGVSIERAK